MNLIVLAICLTTNLGVVMYTLLQDSLASYFISDLDIFALQHLFTLIILAAYIFMDTMQPELSPKLVAWNCIFLAGNILIFGVVKINLAKQSGTFIYFFQPPQKPDILLGLEICFFYSLNFMGQIGILLLLIFFLRQGINTCFWKFKEKSVIERLERDKQEATGDEEPCPICFEGFEEEE